MKFSYPIRCSILIHEHCSCISINILYIYLGIKKINKFFLNRQGLSSSYHVLRTTEHSPGDGRKIKLKYKSAPFTLTTLFFNFTSKALMRQTESLLL